MMRVVHTALGVLAVMAPLLGFAAQTDITFIVAGKTSNHRQAGSGEVSVLNYHFFAEIFLQANGRVTPSSLETPLSKGVAVPFRDSGYALEMHGGRYVTQVVRMANPRVDGSGLPAPPHIMLSQLGKPVSPGHIDPDRDLRVTWSEFRDGGADPLGIMDDLLFVIMGDCDGVRRAHSGRPYENTPYLTYADQSFVIKAEQLEPENVYQLSVEHAVLDTGIEHEVVAFATFATTTFLDIHTTGKAQPGRACHAIRKKFDAGQAVL
jgi:hypothetical protein